MENVISVNRVNTTLTQEQFQKAQSALAALLEVPPFLIDLSVEERKGMLKFGDKNRSFVAKAYAIAQQHPEILPRNFNLDEMKQAVGLVESLKPPLHKITDIQAKVENTSRRRQRGLCRRLAGLSVCQGRHLATGTLEDALDDLGKRFARRSPNERNEQPPPNPPPQAGEGMAMHEFYGMVGFFHEVSVMHLYNI